MDFRYIVITVLCGVMFLALAWDEIRGRRPNLTWLPAALGGVCGLFALSSALFFLLVQNV